MLGSDEPDHEQDHNQDLESDVDAGFSAFPDDSPHKQRPPHYATLPAPIKPTTPTSKQQSHSRSRSQRHTQSRDSFLTLPGAQQPMMPAGLQSFIIAEELAANHSRAASIGGKGLIGASGVQNGDGSSADAPTAPPPVIPLSPSSSFSVANSPSSASSSLLPLHFDSLPPLSSRHPMSMLVFKEGFLTKQGGRVKNWKVRYFKLVPGRLLYYVDGEAADKASTGGGDSGRLGSLLLPGASLAVFSNDVFPGHAYAFGVTPIDQDRQYIMSADNEAHRASWLATLQSHVRTRLKMVASSLREGFLTKQGGSIKTWKKRWVVLTREALKYYEHFMELNDCYGTIDLTNGFTVSSTDDDQLLQQDQQQQQQMQVNSPHMSSNHSDPYAAQIDDEDAGFDGCPPRLNTSTPDAHSPTSTSSSPAPSSPASPAPSHSPSSPSATSPSTTATSATTSFPPNCVYGFYLRAHGKDRRYIFVTHSYREREAWIRTLTDLQRSNANSTDRK